MDLKKQAAQKALEAVQNGMVLGLGTGSTTANFIDLLGEKLNSGGLRDICAVPTSKTTAAQATSLGIPLARLSDHVKLDLVVDGADEVDRNLDMIKGLGKALLREKFVEIHTQHLIIIVDESKLVSRLGQRGALPIEIVQFEWRVSVNWLNSLGCVAELWRDESGEPYITDNGNYLARCWFGSKDAQGRYQGIPDPGGLADLLAQRPGIVEHGLFLDMASEVIVAGKDGIWSVERSK